MGYAVSPALRKALTDWVDVGPVDNFSRGIPQKAEYTLLKRDGWVEETVKRALWVLNKDGKEFIAYDPRCTHLGCAYSWQANRNRFFCPCHGGTPAQESGAKVNANLPVPAAKKDQL